MEQLKGLRIEVEEMIKVNVNHDSQALGIPAYMLYRKILMDFIHKPAEDRKRVYLYEGEYGIDTDESE